MTTRPASPLRACLNVIWQVPLWSVPFALFFGTLYGAGWSSYVAAYKISLVFGYSISFSIFVLEQFILAPRARREQVRPGGGRNFPLEPLLYLVASLFGTYIAALIIHNTLLPGFLSGWRSILINGMFGLLFTVLIGGIAYAIHFYRQSMERARQIEGVRAELAQAELRALRAQIHPHFLFNTLNAIASLIHEKPAAAEEMTTRLADIFRYALRASEREYAPLGEELAFLRDYLGIERMRFGPRLRIEERIEPGLESVPVPSLLLQPLVENAVRHGIAPRPEGGTITISARRNGNHLALEVADDGAGFRSTGPAVRSDDGGFGLHAVRERLRAQGLQDALAIESEPGRGSSVRIVLPLDGAGPLPTPEGVRP
ncbi:MAG: sensor histidine kinase [Candidatus Eiseniibacteriota bacterium]